MKTITTAFFLFLMSFAIAGCNTTRGIGQDIEATGETIEEVAEEAKENMSE